MNPRFSAVILAYERPQLLKQALEAVFAQTFSFSEVIVTNNGSAGDGQLAAMIQKEFPSVRLLQNPYNGGFSKAMNRGFEAASGDWVFFLTDDIKLQPDFLEKITQALSKWPKAALFTGAILNPDGTANFSGGTFDLQSILKMNIHFQKLPEGQKDFKIGYAPGCLMCIRRDVFQKIKGFDENIFLYYEDVDLCRRISECGYDLVLLPAAKACHLGEGHIWDEKKISEHKIFSYYYFHLKHCSGWNLRLFFLRLFFSPNIPFKLRFGWIRMLPSLVRTRQKK